MNMIICKECGHAVNTDKEKCWSSIHRQKREKPLESQIGPKGTEWNITYRHWDSKGSTLHTAFIFDYENGLTAVEAWQKTTFEHNPGFHEVICEQISPFPFPKDKVKQQ